MGAPSTKDVELVDNFRQWLQKADAAHKKWRDTFRVEDLDKYWEGDQQPSWWNEDFFCPINLVFANIQRQLDNFTTVTPYYHVRPSRTYTPVPDFLPQFEQQAKVRESLLNAFVQSSVLKREVRKAALDAYLAFGVVKVYYQPYLRENPNFGKNIPGLNTPQSPYRLFKENFIASRRNPMDIRLDPFADSMENLTKVAERVEYTLEEVQSNKLFKNTSDLKPYKARTEEKQNDEERKRGSNSMQPMTGGNSSMSGSSLGKDREDIIHVWEVYDIKEQRIQAFADGHDKPLRDDSMPDAIDNHSYVFLWFIDRRNSAYPIPGVWHQIGPQDEYNITRNQVMLHRRRFNRKYQTRETAISDTELAKLENPYDGVVIKTKQDGEVIRPIQDAPLDQAVYFDTVQLRRDFMDVSGEPVQESEISKIEKASVANLLAASQQGRTRGMRAVFQDFYQNLACKLIKLYEVELTLPMAVTVAGADGYSWKQINPRAIQASSTEYYYEVSAESLIPQTPEGERASWLAYMEFMAIHPNFGANPVIAEKTARAFGVFDKQVIQAVIQAAQATIEQAMLMGGSPGKPGISNNSASKQMMGA